MTDIALFIHSTGTGPFMWKPLLQSLPPGVQAVLPVNRGYSPADLLPRGTSIGLADEVAHLKAQIPAGTTGVHLVAHSYGGLVALTLALDAEVPVKSAWLYEPVLFGALKAVEDTLPDDAAEHVRRLYGDTDFLLNDDTGGLAPWLAQFVDYWNHPGMWDSMSEKSRAMAQVVGWKMFQEVRMVSTEARPFGHYRLGLPMTLVHGERTQPPARDMVRRLAAVNPHAQVDVLADLGHMSVLTRPEAVLPSLAAHWRRVTGS